MILHIDTRNTKIVMLNAIDTMKEGNTFYEYPLGYDELTGLDYSSIEGALTNFVAQHGKISNNNTTVIIPDNFVSIDFITVPTISKFQIDNAFKTEYKNLYKNNGELIMRYNVYSSNKKNTTYVLSLIQKRVYENIFAICAKFGVNVRTLIPESMSVGESLLSTVAVARKKNCMFVDVDEFDTRFVFLSHERTVGYAFLPFGANILSDAKVFAEDTLYVNSVADLAVINAKEIAKATKLTVTMELDDVDEDEPNDEVKEMDATSESDTLTVTQPPVNMRELIDEQKLEDEAKKLSLNSIEEDDDKPMTLPDNSKAYEEFRSSTANAKVYVKKVRKLPTYLQRPLPTEPRGFILENFRAIEKKILNYMRFCQFNENIGEVEAVILRLPSQYRFIIECLNADENNKVHYLDYDSEKDNSLPENLSLALLGGNYFGKFSKKQGIQ